MATAEENLILKNWRQQEKNFIDNLFTCRKRPTKASVHELRVAVKRLRSYLRLKKQITGQEWKGSFSNILILFKSFGQVSDLDMSITLIKQQERKEQLSFQKFRDHLSVNRALNRKWVKQDAMKFNTRELDILTDQFNLDLTDKEICEKILHYSVLKIKKVKILSKHFQKNSHKIRKQLKDVYSWIKICPKDFIEHFIRIRSLDQMLKYLGGWQDHYVLRKKINQFSAEISQSEEKTLLKTMENKLADIQDDFLEKAKHKWKTVLQHST